MQNQTNSSVPSDVYLQIKALCKQSRQQKGLSNQDIADMISERFHLEDFSVNTINNFFSDRSKAPTIYTVGYICAVLDVSLDQFFDIQTKHASADAEELEKQSSDKDTQISLLENKNAGLIEMIDEKNHRLDQAHEALEHYRKMAEKDRKHQTVFTQTVLISVLVILIIFVVYYLFHFDIGNPQYGLFG